MNRETREMALKYTEDHLDSDEVLYVTHVSGISREESRHSLVKKMATVAWKNAHRPCYDLFRIVLCHQKENPADSFAVQVLVKRKVAGEVKKSMIGFIPKTYKAKPLFWNKAVVKWLDKNQVRRTVLLDVGYSRTSQAAWARIGIVVTANHAALPRGVEPMESLEKAEFRKDEDSEEDLEDIPEDVPPGTRHEGTIPDVATHDLPTEEDITRLLDYQDLLRDLFYEGEESGVSFVFQWGEELRSWDSLEELANYVEQNDCYESAENAVDLQEVAKKYGHTMAQNFYQIEGAFAGPVTRQRVRKINDTLKQVVRLISMSPMSTWDQSD